MLLKISRDKAYEQFIKTEKGKITHRIREIRDRHKNAFDVQVVEKTVMRVMLNGLYHQHIPNAHKRPMVAEGQACRPRCKQVCSECNVCVHMFDCTCIDYLTRLHSTRPKAIVILPNLVCVHISLYTANQKPV